MPSLFPGVPALRLFVAVIDSGSIGAGARALAISQPNASRSIAALEQLSGTRLLIRSAGGSAPTAAGMRLAAAARPLLSAATNVEQVFATTRGQTAEPLTVAASMTIAEQLVPRWLPVLRRAYPAARVDPVATNSTHVLELVRSGAVGLGLIETPHVPSWVNSTPIGSDELTVVVGPTHPWAQGRQPVSLAELADTPLITREVGSGTREALDELLAPHSPVDAAHVLTSNTAVLVAVAAGTAPAVLSTLAVADQVAAGRLIPVPLADTVVRPLTAVWTGPRRLRGIPARLVAIAKDDRAAVRRR